MSASHNNAAEVRMTEEIIHWVRSVGPDGNDLVRMICKGRLTRYTDEGRMGDVKVRPESLGPGEYTMVVAAGDCRRLNGTPLR